MIEGLVVLLAVVALVVYLMRRNGDSDQPEVRPIMHGHDCIHCSLMYSCGEANCYGQRYGLCEKCGMKLNDEDFSR